MNNRIYIGLLLLIPLIAGCAVSNQNVPTPAAVYYPTLPQGVTTIAAAEKELALLLREVYAITYDATPQFPHYKVLKDFVEHSKPDLGMATKLYYFEGDRIMMILVNGISVSGTKLSLPIFSIFFEEMVGFPIKLNETQIELPNRVTITFPRNETGKAQKAADLLFFIQQNIAIHNQEKLAEFEKKAIEYRALRVKPPIPEEQRRYIVQANALNERKDYAGAIDMYIKAVEVDPVSYPAAYFNLALLSAQTHRFKLAIAYMKQYLLLEPEAQDARSGQDKIYEWELMIKK
ncbi:MAG: hypothetical protein C4576_29375 [Desulfobacteraceae bacterium]|nr:MAG: hypothetical protein C4576_29375 [Desulfobacteraceae bacterium]